MVNYKVGEYYDGENDLPKGCIRISPSGIERFFNEKVDWYRENLLHEDKKFKGSTATLLGTIVHHAAEVVANCKLSNTPYNSEKLHLEVNKYIDSFEDNKTYDLNKVRSLWEEMSVALIKEFVLDNNIVKTEEFICYNILDNIWPSGTYDAIVSTVPNDDLMNPIGVLTVRDYKTASSKPSTFPYKYKLQAFTYAYILAKKGIKISNVEVCYVIQPTKTLPVRTFNFSAPFDDKAYHFIENILNLIAESIDVFENYPHCRYLLAGDYRLKEKQ